MTASACLPVGRDLPEAAAEKIRKLFLMRLHTKVVGASFRLPGRFLHG